MVGKVLMAAGLACLLLAPAALAQPQFDMCYDYVDMGGGVYEYTFEVELNDGWKPGMGWRWYIFGDQMDAPSPLTDFVGDRSYLPVGPWGGYGSSGGHHNGPTLSRPGLLWIPESRDETLVWGGTSTAALEEPDMLYSTISGTVGGATAHDFTVAKMCGPKIDCDAITKYKAKCRNGKFKGMIKKSSLPEGTQLTLLNNGGDAKVVNINRRGKGKAKWTKQSGKHEMTVEECPNLPGKTADCGE